MTLYGTSKNKRADHHEYHHYYRMFCRCDYPVSGSLEYDAGRTGQHFTKAYATESGCTGNHCNHHRCCGVFVTVARKHVMQAMTELANCVVSYIFSENQRSIMASTYRVRIMKKTLAILVATTTLSIGFSAHAEESIIDEARFGGTWAQPDWLDANHTEAEQAGINGQLLFKPVNIDVFGLGEGSDSYFLNALFNPRPTIGGMANFDKHGTSYVHAGLNWHFALGETFFVEAGFGGAWNNGSDVPTATRAGIGSNWVFNESLALGVNVTEDITAVLQWDHLSHRDFFGSHNRGLNNLSARIGVKF